MFAKILAIVFPVFAIVALGYFYARRHRPDMAAANRLNLEIFTPALIFSVLAGKDFQLTEYGPLVLAAVVVVLGSGLIAWPVARMAGWQAKTFVPPMMFTNSGNMGLPLALFAFGESALPVAVVLFLVENLLHFTVGNVILEGRVRLTLLFTMPILLATWLGLVVAVTGFDLWTPLQAGIDLLGQIAIPLMLFALGVRMTGVDRREWRMGLVGAVLCPLSGLLLAVPMIWLLDLVGMDAAQLLLFAALPPAVLNFLLAEKFHQEPHRVASLVLMGNAGSLLLLPLVLWYLL